MSMHGVNIILIVILIVLTSRSNSITPHSSIILMSAVIVGTIWAVIYGGLSSITIKVCIQNGSSSSSKIAVVKYFKSYIYILIILLWFK